MFSRPLRPVGSAGWVFWLGESVKILYSLHWNKFTLGQSAKSPQHGCCYGLLLLCWWDCDCICLSLMLSCSLSWTQKEALMEQVAHQAVAMQFILEMARNVQQDPRGCFRQFFQKAKVRRSHCHCTATAPHCTIHTNATVGSSVQCEWHGNIFTAVTQHMPGECLPCLISKHRAFIIYSWLRVYLNV